MALFPKEKVPYSTWYFFLRVLFPIILIGILQFGVLENYGAVFFDVLRYRTDGVLQYSTVRRTVVQYC